MSLEEIIKYIKESIKDAESDKKCDPGYFDGKITAYSIVLLLLDEWNGK